MASLVPPVRIMPRTGIPVADVLTNIGATDLLSRPEDFSPRQTAKSLDRTNPDPIWITRWQNSTSPPDERPWVKAFRWWEALVPFQSWGPDPLYRIDFKWKGIAMGYAGIGQSVWFEFTRWTGSVGEWFHDNILKPGWNGRTVRGSRYREIPL